MAFHTNPRKRETTINWDQVEGKWLQLKGQAKEKWGQLTDDDLDVAAGRRDQLAGKIQHRYGVAKEEAERQLDDWSRKL
nr:CsbD family protein [Rhodobacter kunshanensis]